MYRRGVLTTLGVALTAGCAGLRGADTPTEKSPESETRNPTSTPTETEPSTATPLPSPRSFLPESQDGWTRERLRDYTWSPLGGDDGMIGEYTGPDGREYQMVVMEDPDNARGSARGFASAGWQLTFVEGSFVVAASSGTDQTATPEAPPLMSATPAPEKLEYVRELVLLSPRIEESDLP